MSPLARWLPVALALAACSSKDVGDDRGDTTAAVDDAGAAADTPDPRDSATARPGDGGVAPADAGPEPAPDTGAPVLPSRDLRCGDPAPEGAPMPPPLPEYSGGECPVLEPGVNSLVTGGATRELILVVPSDLRPDERLPVLVLWHYLGGAANSLLEHGRIQEAANELRFIALIPEKKGDIVVDLFFDEVDFAWPYLTTDSDSRVREEVTFFDDMLACAAEQYDVDPACVSTAGVSAGALWAAQLAQLRSERLASAILLSGGVGPATSSGFIEVRGWRGASHAMPVLLGWGGPSDECGIDFERASHNLEETLVAGGHFVEECIHNCGHAAPPVAPEVGLPILWRFALDHPYWLRDGESPYLAAGLPEGTPTWCAVGAGRAMPRVGSCEVEGDSLDSCPVPAL